MWDFQRREVDWEKVPTVPRPSLIADPITAFGKPRAKPKHTSILDPINRANIKPDQRVLNAPLKPYISARDETRQRVFDEVRRNETVRSAGGSMAATTDKDSMDILLKRLHRAVPVQTSNHQYIMGSASRY